MNKAPLSCDNCNKSFEQCFSEHNHEEIKLLDTISLKFNLCEDLTRYISDFAFSKNHTIRFKYKRFVYYSDDDESNDELDIDFIFTNEKYIICEKCMIICIDYFFTNYNRLPSLRNDAQCFIWNNVERSNEFIEKHYVKHKYILPSVYYCDYYRNHIPLTTDEGRLQITES